MDSDAIHAAALQERRHTCIKLYYRTLQTMLWSERRTVGGEALRPLVLSRTFHTCLFACCCEVVAHTYKMVSIALFFGSNRPAVVMWS